MPSETFRAETGCTLEFYNSITPVQQENWLRAQQENFAHKLAHKIIEGQLAECLVRAEGGQLSVAFTAKIDRPRGHWLRAEEIMPSLPAMARTPGYTWDYGEPVNATGTIGGQPRDGRAGADQLPFTAANSQAVSIVPGVPVSRQLTAAEIESIAAATYTNIRGVSAVNDRASDDAYRAFAHAARSIESARQRDELERRGIRVDYARGGRSDLLDAGAASVGDGAATPPWNGTIAREQAEAIHNDLLAEGFVVIPNHTPAPVELGGPARPAADGNRVVDTGAESAATGGGTGATCDGQPRVAGNP